VGVNSVERLRESIVNGIELTQEEVVYLEQPCVLCFVVSIVVGLT
jgi:hypothetical protein